VNRHHRFITRAVSLAYLSECRWRHGAVITKGSVVMAVSSNIPRNSSDIDFANATYHAEIAALRELYRVHGWNYNEPKPLKEYTMYVARIDIRDRRAMSRPCEDCWQTLDMYGINNVYYTNELGALSHESIMW
jgi:tRNA(Arg) A34 adenosine deaminase TadA